MEGEEENMLINSLTGLVPAVITPMQETGDIYPGKVEDLMEYLRKQDISAVFVGGSTGEGTSLTMEEKKEIFAAYKNFSNDIPVIAQVGEDCLKNSIKLAEYAAKIGIKRIAALPPRYFAPEDACHLKNCIKEIASVNKQLPFYYYHIPELSGVEVNMFEFLKECEGEVNNLRGIKYSQNKFPEMLKCIVYKDGKYNIFHGLDQTLLNGLTMGVEAAIGSGYNFAAPLYNNLIKAFNNGNLDKARDYQSRAIQMMDLIMNKYRGHPAFKAIMKIIGIDCGPTRKPLRTLDGEEIKSLEEELKQMGFFEWIEK